MEGTLCVKCNILKSSCKVDPELDEVESGDKIFNASR